MPLSSVDVSALRVLRVHAVEHLGDQSLDFQRAREFALGDLGLFDGVLFIPLSFLCRSNCGGASDRLVFCRSVGLAPEPQRHQQPRGDHCRQADAEFLHALERGGADLCLGCFDTRFVDA
jgi:hypothetical protein